MSLESSRIGRASTTFGAPRFEVTANHWHYVTTTTKFWITKAPPPIEPSSSELLAAFHNGKSTECSFGEVVCPPLVDILLTLCGPAKIDRKISFIVVDAIEFHPFWSWAEISFYPSPVRSVASIFIAPRRVDSYASVAITFVAFILWIMAPLDHLVPSVIFFSFGIAMFYFVASCVLVVWAGASATALVIGSKVGSFGLVDTSTVAKHFPYEAIVVPKQFLYDSVTESFVDQAHRLMTFRVLSSRVFLHGFLLILTITLFHGGI